MCLATVYDQRADAAHALLKDAQSLVVRQDQLLFTDLLEREYEFRGQLLTADFVNGQIIIKLAES
ncbi:MAG: CooT family nickel-binding protein [Actinomycetia bacterium]|nr:CooT family nickel-binding protein [Actinomycetes bacterium]